MRSKSVIFMLDPFILPRLNGIAAFAAAHNWILVPDDRVSPQTDYRRFDGALCSLRGRSPQLTKIRRLLSLNKPVVDLTVACDSIRVPRVASDHLACGRLAASHLLSLGIDNIVWYASATSKVHRLRYNGVARELGRPPTRLSPATLRHELMHSEKPLGVVAYSETDAERVISECKRLSLDIPDVVAVISIGNDPFLCENREITISAVDTNLAQGAYEAARLLDTFIESPRKWQRARSMVRLIPPQSVVPRKSTDTLTHPCGLIRDVLIYIHRHLDRPLGASEVAEACAIARTTLDRNFRKVIGHSIGSEILNQRMQLAKRLLRDCELPLKAIAARCGFCNQAFFSTVFKRAIPDAPLPNGGKQPDRDCGLIPSRPTLHETCAVFRGLLRLWYNHSTMNNISLAAVVALATGLAIAGDVKNGTVTCARFEPGTVIDYSCWASDGAKDGEAAVYVFIEWGVGGVKDSLAKLMAEGKIPEGIAVSFNAGTLKSSDGKLSRGMRAGELDQPGAEYPSAIAEEIVPSAEKLLGVRASKSPDLHFITGASSGGIAAWNACWFRNDWFRRCYCNSPTFSNMRAGTQLMALVRKCETRPIRVYLTCGTDEPDYFFGDSYFVAADAVGALRFAGYELRFERYPHFGHGVMWGNRSHLEKVLTWLFEDWRTKPVAVVTNPLRVRDATARGSTWESCDFQMPPAAREARSSDRWRRYTVAPDNRFVMSERVRPDGAFDQRVRLAPLELAWNATRVGGTALTVAADDRIWVATELGVQGMVSFGLADVVLPLPGDLPCDNVALVGTTLYASSGDRVFRRSVKVGAADPANPSTPATPGYDDGFWYSRDHEPAGGVGELIGSYVTAGRIAGAVSAMCDGDGGETYACEGWSVYGGRNRDRLSPDTLFTIGATAAIFRSVALMCALDEGKRSLDEIGEPYEAYLRRKVLAPLGLKDTTFAPNDKQRARLAKTYNSNDERIRLVERPVAPGELYSSPRDLLRLAQLIAHRGTWEGQAIVSRKTFDRVWSGITGDPRIDLRVDAKTGRCAVFCIQTDSTTGSAFLQLKRDWHAACDIEPRTDVPW